MKLHYSQTVVPDGIGVVWFQYLMKLHYSQTPLVAAAGEIKFQYLMKLHYSQTGGHRDCVEVAFQYLMKLHYSQTSNFKSRFSPSKPYPLHSMGQLHKAHFESTAKTLICQRFRTNPYL